MSLMHYAGPMGRQRSNMGIIVSDEWTDIEDEAGNVIGQLNLTTMRALAPHPELNKVIEAGGDFYYRKNGRRLHLRIDPPPKKSRRR